MEKNVLSTAMALNASHLNRTANMMRDSVRLAISRPDAGTLAEATELTRATMKRAKAMQNAWIAEWEDWLDYTKALSGADTIPKFMEHSGNIALRAQAQMLAQMTDLTGLTENFAVSYTYWASRKLRDGDD